MDYGKKIFDEKKAKAVAKKKQNQTLMTATNLPEAESA
jgi:translation initiation factor IF-3